MAKTKRKTKRAQSDEPVPEKPSGNRLTRLLFRPWFLLMLAVAVSATVLIPVIRHALPDLRARKEYRLTAADIEISQPPPWVPRNLVEQALSAAGLSETMSLLDDDLNEKIARALRAHPWVAEVILVRRSIPAKVHAELAYRKPVAMVKMKQGVYPVDGDAVLLPPSDFSPDDVARYPLIVNVPTPPRGAAGTSWGDVSVLGAARLAETLQPHWKSFQLSAISAPRRVAANTTIEGMIFELHTNGGSRIIWGRAPQSGHPGELSAEQKIGRLKDYLARFGGFEEPHGPYEIDIRHWQEISRRRIAVAK